MNSRHAAVLTTIASDCALADPRLLKQHVTCHLREGRLLHVLDLSDLENLSPRLMLTLLALFYAAQRAGGILALVVSKSAALHALTLAGLDGVIPMFVDVMQAVDAVRDRTKAKAIA